VQTSRKLSEFKSKNALHICKSVVQDDRIAELESQKPLDLELVVGSADHQGEATEQRLKWVVGMQECLSTHSG